MEILRRQLGDTTVIELRGKLDYAFSYRELKRVLADLDQRGCAQVVMDLGHVDHIDTTCLGLLIGAHVACTRRGGGLRFVQTPPRIRHVLHIARLDDFLLTCDTHEDAIRSF